MSVPLFRADREFGQRETLARGLDRVRPRPVLEVLAAVGIPGAGGLIAATFGDAAHSVAFEQADAVQQLLTGTIVPATYRR